MKGRVLFLLDLGEGLYCFKPLLHPAFEKSAVRLGPRGPARPSPSPLSLVPPYLSKLSPGPHALRW